MPSDLAENIIKNNSNWDSYFTYTIPTELPELEDDEQYNKRIQDYRDNSSSSFRDTRSWGRNENGNGSKNTNGYSTRGSSSTRGRARGRGTWGKF